MTDTATEELKAAAEAAGFYIVTRQPAAGQRCMHKQGCAEAAALEVYTGSGRLERLLCKSHAEGYVMTALSYQERRAKRARQ